MKGYWRCWNRGAPVENPYLCMTKPYYMKRNLHTRGSMIVALLFASLFFTACKKSHPCDTDMAAKGSLQDVEGNCLPGTAHGPWIAGLTPSADSNYVDVTVRVTSPGS